jgi:type III pantothenate kinase
MNGELLVAVDVGNSRIKLGAYSGNADDGVALPEPSHKLHLTSHKIEFQLLAEWIAALLSDATMGNAESALGYGRHPNPAVHWAIGSVNRGAASCLIDWLRDNRREDSVAMLSADDLPLSVELPRPDMVGIDRLLDALAANRLRTRSLPAVVVSVGSAITVDLVDADGAFRGGAILPGIGMSARALHEYTDLLPEIQMHELSEPPAPLGSNTIAALQSGLFWGAVGAIRELISRLTNDQPADIFLTGGAGESVAKLIGPSTRCIPHLNLSGIAIAYRSKASRSILP